MARPVKELPINSTDMSERRKVLLVLNTINDYRVETYNIINQVFDFTVAYNVADQTVKKCEFKKIKFNTHKFGPFHIFGRQFWEECKKYDAVITSFDIHNFEFALIPFIRRKYKLLTWSIGLRCSYTRPYDVNRKHEVLDSISYRIMKSADANIFYMEKAREFWQSTKLDQNKIFIAPNTTNVIDIEPNKPKNSILFVGTLYKSKGVDKLIEAFSKAISDTDSNITLDIVGKGDEKSALEELAENLGIKEKVIFHGPIYDEAQLSKLFEKALASVSPTQAGLTVPKSMGYGVPMITRTDAISGGEIYHISHNITGIFYDNDDELSTILRDIISNKEKYITMGEKAMSYYKNHATPRHQANGVIEALKYALND